MAYSALYRLRVHAQRYTRRQALPFLHRSRLFTAGSAFTTPDDGKKTASSSVVSSRFCRPKAVIFDVGGVVVPSPLPLFAQFEEEHSLRPGSVVHTIKETGETGSFAKLERGELTVEEFSGPFSEEYQTIFGRATRPEIFRELLESFREGRQVTARSAVVGVIERLTSHGIKTAILTNNFRYDDGYVLFPKGHLTVDVVCFQYVQCMLTFLPPLQT